MSGRWSMPGITVVDVRQLAAEALAVAVAETPEIAVEIIPQCLAALDRLHAAGWAMARVPEAARVTGEATRGAETRVGVESNATTPDDLRTVETKLNRFTEDGGKGA